MRIKKIENVVGLVGSVLNKFSKSNKDTYSANYLNDRIVKVSDIEPTTGEKVWIDDVNKKIYIKKDNDVYEEIYNEEEHNKEVYSTEEQVIGTWIDGKPIYRQTISFEVTTSNNIRYVIKELDTLVKLYGVAKSSTNMLNINHVLEDDFVSAWISKASGSWSVYGLCSPAYTGAICYLTLEYTKTTD